MVSLYGCLSDTEDDSDKHSETDQDDVKEIICYVGQSSPGKSNIDNIKQINTSPLIVNNFVKTCASLDNDSSLPSTPLEKLKKPEQLGHPS